MKNQIERAEPSTECPRCGSTSPSRALGGCFHSWHADPELRAEPSRGAPLVITKLRATRDAYHNQYGVPISHEYAEFLNAIGDLAAGHVVLLEALRRLTEDFFPKTCTHGGEPWYCDGCRYAWEKELAARKVEAKSLVEGQQ